MLNIVKFTCESLEKNILTDCKNPSFRYIVSSDKNGVTTKSVKVSCNGWVGETSDSPIIVYEGKELEPFSTYQATIEIEDSEGEKATKSISFETGFLGSAWQAKWITDGSYNFTEKRVSPIPMVFRKKIELGEEVESVQLFATALGIYDVYVDDEHISNTYFAPGFTSYKTHLQYQRYDLTKAIKDGSNLYISVAGGWAVGSYVFTRVNRVTAPRQALYGEIHVKYKDGRVAIIPTDTSWEVGMNGPISMADIYDGETYDARISLSSVNFSSASVENVKINPVIEADYGSPVIEHEHLTPKFIHKDSKGGYVYDCGQNFAGIVKLKIKDAKGGEFINVKHAEILQTNGDLNTLFLRSAKCEINYTCRLGDQEYAPTFTYMGFRYICIYTEKLPIENIEVDAVALYSDIEQIGDFQCSNELINRLQQNIIWSSRSNFVDIPTDCPQRDERMGWTGDIAVFAPTATFNFELSRFLDKWLRDLKAEQTKGGGIPNTIPNQGYGFPATMPKMAIDWWGDACVLVPYQQYLASGDKTVLENLYPTMTKYIKACKFWANLFSFGQSRYIWSGPLSTFHFGDWIAPDVPKMGQWQARHKWTATASLRNTTSIVSKIAEILGKEKDAKYYAELSENVAAAYVNKFTDGNGKLKSEFQTAYVLPIHMNMFSSDEIKHKAAENLANLVKNNDYCIGTGFPGTPYILFALADNKQEEVAFKMLTNTKCPSWLYEVKTGGTTIWERWDGLDENGNCDIKDDGTGSIPMISYNHYASGAVGDFFYKRIAGIEPTEAGYKSFKIKPIVGGDITCASAYTISPYGKISSSWKIEGNEFSLDIEVPVNTKCMVTLPNGEESLVTSGKHSFKSSI